MHHVVFFFFFVGVVVVVIVVIVDIDSHLRASVGLAASLSMYIYVMCNVSSAYVKLARVSSACKYNTSIKFPLLIALEHGHVHNLRCCGGLLAAA